MPILNNTDGDLVNKLARKAATFATCDAYRLIGRTYPTCIIQAGRMPAG